MNHDLSSTQLKWGKISSSQAKFPKLLVGGWGTTNDLELIGLQSHTLAFETFAWNIHTHIYTSSEGAWWTWVSTSPLSLTIQRLLTSCDANTQVLVLVTGVPSLASPQWKLPEVCTLKGHWDQDHPNLINTDKWSHSISFRLAFICGTQIDGW